MAGCGNRDQARANGNRWKLTLVSWPKGCATEAGRVALPLFREKLWRHLTKAVQASMARPRLKMAIVRNWCWTLRADQMRAVAGRRSNHKQQAGPLSNL